LLLGCGERRTGDAARDSAAALEAARVADGASQTPRAEVPVSSMRLEVDVTARELHVYRDSRRIATHPVAVGSPEWPTRTGEWHVTQVVWNPEWIPPDESWAEEREGKQPGAPDNPLGRAQIIYDPPRTIHGTNDPSSIGKAVSHGSIRVTNEVATALARQLMEETGAGKSEDWYRETQRNRTVKQIVNLPQRVPIRVF
jgi:lipoprotein-anchoring transpeptidase ErfK/SrfK